MRSLNMYEWKRKHVERLHCSHACTRSITLKRAHVNALVLLDMFTSAVVLYRTISVLSSIFDLVEKCVVVVKRTISTRDKKKKKNKLTRWNLFHSFSYVLDDKRRSRMNNRHDYSSASSMYSSSLLAVRLAILDGNRSFRDWIRVKVIHEQYFRVHDIKQWSFLYTQANRHGKEKTETNENYILTWNLFNDQRIRQWIYWLTSLVQQWIRWLTNKNNSLPFNCNTRRKQTNNETVMPTRIQRSSWLQWRMKTANVILLIELYALLSSMIQSRAWLWFDLKRCFYLQLLISDSFSSSIDTSVDTRRRVRYSLIFSFVYYASIYWPMMNDREHSMNTLALFDENARAYRREISKHVYQTIDWVLSLN
jgi:hypothetical protein